MGFLRKQEPAGSSRASLVPIVDACPGTRRLGSRAGARYPPASAARASNTSSARWSVSRTAGAVADAVRSCPHLRLRGLMTMPPWSDDAEPSRPYFRQLRELGERIGVSEFSMGMSHDFEVAIEEGATHIRVGTALFGRRKKKV